MTKKSLEGMRTEERRGAGGETRRDAEEEKDERSREGMGEGGELKKGGANTERGRQQKTIAGLFQAILSMLNWDAVRGKRRTRAQQKGRVTPRRKTPAWTQTRLPAPESPSESPAGKPQPEPPSTDPNQAPLPESPRETPGESPFEKPARPTHRTAKALRTVISRRWRRFRRGRL